MSRDKKHKKWTVALLSLGLTGIIGGIGMNACATTTVLEQNRQQKIFVSPQWKEDQFVNVLPRYDASMGKMLWQWIKGGEQTTPKKPLPIQRRSRDDFAQTSPASLNITWIGHSTTLIDIDGYRVLTDPVWSDRVSPIAFVGPKRFFPPPLKLDDLPPIDAVVISHDHFDHLDEKTVKALKNKTRVFAVPLGVGAHLHRWGIGPDKVMERDWWESIDLGKLQLVAVPARHFSGRSLVMADQDQTLWAGWVVQGPTHRVYFSGDTAMFPGFAEIGRRLGPFDATLIEIGAYNAMWADVHIGPEQAIEAFQMLRGKHFIPIHWGTFDLALHGWTEPVERLRIAAQKAGVSISIPKPGQTVAPNRRETVEKWWPEVPWKTAEQSPLISSGLAQAPTSSTTF